jgi:UDP-glucuronate 4-epimerase
MIEVLERALGRKADKKMLPMQPGDVEATYADIAAINLDYGFQPTTTIENGIPKFVSWFRNYHGLGN